MSAVTELPGLRDIALGEPVSYAPATPAWAILGVLVLAGAVVLAARRLRLWRADAYRRRALAELAELRRALDEDRGRDDALASLAPLVKRTVLAFAPRERVAALTGEAWLDFLDGTAPGLGFSGGPGRDLERLAFEAPERRRELPDADARALFDVVEAWTRTHRRSGLGRGDE